MKSNELRIGNLIRANTDKIVETVCLLGVNVNGCSPNYYEPIPLTEDWLLKFGFENIGVSSIMSFKGFWIRCEVDDGSSYISDLSLGDIELFDINPEYVHQLQNLYFALTGQELEITTPQK